MEIGKQIQILRKKNKISSKKLVLGLCSTRTLNYIESGTELPDKMLADILIQRLGKSSDKLELIISKEIYQLERMQDLFEEALERGNRKRAEELLEKYKEVAPKNNVYQMFYCRSRAYLAFRLDSNLMESKDWIEQAIDITIPEWRNNLLETYLISTIEIENLLAYAKLLLREETKHGLVEAEELLLSCRKYIDEHILDREEYAKIYCKCADLLAEIYLAKKDFCKVSTLCEKAFNELRDFGIIYYMQPLLEKLVLCNDEFLHIEKNQMYQMYQVVLQNVYKRYKKEWHFTDSIFKNCCQRTYYMDYELIRGERLLQRLTQEQLIEGIYENPESLSRVESGKVSPRNKTFVQIFEKLGIEKGRYNTFIVTESFEVLEMKKELDRLTSRRLYDEADKKLKELKEILDLSVVENQRIVYGLELALASVLNKELPEKLLEEMIQLLQETYPINQKENSRVPLDREVYLLNHIIILLRKLGKDADVKELYSYILDTMKKSKIRIRYRFRSYSTIMTNFAKQNCSVLIAQRNIKYILTCGKLRGLYMNCLTEACALINNPTNQKICREVLLEAYYLCKLAKNTVDVKIISQYYEGKFGTSII